MTDKLRWTRVADADDLEEGRVRPVTCGHRTLCLTRHEGKTSAMDNRCPHQGGPLGEGSIENGWLRCPWHGWDFDPHTGRSPGSHEDGVEMFPVEEREDGVYVGMVVEDDHERTATDMVAETLVNWGVKWTFGMVGHSNLSNPSFAAVAEQCGLLGLKVERAEDLDAALVKALAHDGPALVEVMTDAALI